MLFNLYSPRIDPILDIYKWDLKRGNAQTVNTIGHHSEIARPEYNYIFNKDGMRSVEFSTYPKVIALGCSITVGVGLPVDLIWHNLLSKLIDKPIGTISYSGGSIARIISNFFAMINQYKYKPELVICNFPNFERFYFISPEANRIFDYRVHIKPKVTKATAPWDYETILPYEWAYFQNLDYIKMLEVFCESNQIKLIWSTWSNALSEEYENFLKNNFTYYVQDPVRKQFPENFEFMLDVKNVEELPQFYKMYNWESIMCHSEYQEQYPDIFDYAYDYHQNKGSWGRTPIWPHPGIHKHLHWRDFYYSELQKRNWI